MWLLKLASAFILQQDLREMLPLDFVIKNCKKRKRKKLKAIEILIEENRKKLTKGWISWIRQLLRPGTIKRNRDNGKYGR